MINGGDCFQTIRQFSDLSCWPASSGGGPTVRDWRDSSTGFHFKLGIWIVMTAILADALIHDAA
jgi:hypothetical protein